MTDVRIIPLGGLGEIGLNMMVIESNGEAFVIDCGLMFPEPHMPGVDIVIPNFRYLAESGTSLKGIVITHGHEDHIGALPFFLKEFNVPLYATPLTIGLITEKLRQHGLLEKSELIEVEPGNRVGVGPFKVHFLRACHSIPDGCSLAISTPAGTILHSGDFKLEESPVDGKPTDCESLKEYGREGVRLLLSDSTNVENEGWTTPENSLIETFHEIFRESSGKVIFALFSSNINRIQQIVAIAEKERRKIVLVGRSLVSNLKVAMERGYMLARVDTFIGVKEMKNYPPSELAVITTGSQGEPRSGLSLMATKSHKHVTIEEGDTVVLSSKQIPGNEKLVCNIINHLMRTGAEVLYDGIANVHVSGHAHADELREMISMTKPDAFIPIHGERRHLDRHLKLAREVGIPKEKTFLLEDGNSVVLSADGIRRGDSVLSGRVFVDGKGVGDVRDMVLRDRLHLSNDGMVIAVVTIDRTSGDIMGEPELFSKGFLHDEREEEVLKKAKKAVIAFLDETCRDVRIEGAELEAEIMKVMKRFFKKELARRPVVIPLVIEM